ncbi:MAG: protoporphyrinogen oxidase [Polyangiaceae bacterium]
MSRAERVIVIGGGITGLSCAYEIVELAAAAKKNVEVTLLERSGRVGGVISTEKRGGFVLDGGPDSWVATKPHAADLVKRLGLGQELMGTVETNRQVYIAWGKELFLMPEGLVLGIPTQIGPIARTQLFSWDAKLRMALEPFVPVRSFHGDEDESVADFITRRLGDQVTDRLAAPLLGGIFAGNAGAISVRAAFPQLVAAEAKYGSLIQAMRAQRKEREAAAAKADSAPSMFVSLHGGLGRMIDTLAEKLGDRVRTSVGVNEVRLVDDDSDGRFGVETTGGGIERADHVVLAVPSFVSASAVRAMDPGLARSFDGLMGHASSATVFLAFRRQDVAHPLDATGFIVPRAEGRKILAGTWVSSKWGHRAPGGHVLMRVFLGGAEQEEVLERDDDALAALALREVRTMMTIDAEPLFTRVFRFVRASPQPHLGHLGRVRDLRAKLSEIPGLHTASNTYDGVGIPDCIRQAQKIARDIVG